MAEVIAWALLIIMVGGAFALIAASYLRDRGDDQ
jgi:hypothetical protein